MKRTIVLLSPLGQLENRIERQPDIRESPLHDRRDAENRWAIKVSDESSRPRRDHRRERKRK